MTAAPSQVVDGSAPDPSDHTPNMLTYPFIAAVLAVLWGAAPCVAQGAPPNACASATHRQFDFWLGEWEVRNPKGAIAGTSRITSRLDGCVVHEEWTGASGARGESLNSYDPATQRWHQTWVDNSGLLALFDGVLTSGGAMVLEGPGRAPNGAPARSRMTFTPLPDGRVRQLWEFSTDGGATWTTSFDGFYHRRRI